MGLAGAASASTAERHASATSYSFRTLDNANDLTFNQLLGINDFGVIAGYFGSGAQDHPNKGYLLEPGHTRYINENFPGSVQTQVTGLNNRGVTVGFWSSTNMGVGMDANFGFVDVGGRFRNADFPTGDPASPAGGPAARRQRPGHRGRLLHRRQRQQPRLRVQHPQRPVQPRSTESGVTSLTAAAINDLDQVAGFTPTRPPATPTGS